MGRVEDGTTISDFDPEEAKRKASLSASVVPVEYEGIKYNFIDAPGLFDFEAGEYEGIRAAESVLVCVSGRSGVTVGAEKAFQLARKNGKATMVFVSKCDLENANYFKILEDMKIRFGSTVCPCVVPAKLDDGTPVYINLFSQKAFKYESGKQIQVDLPDIGHRFQGLIEAMSEAIAETDDELMEKFFGGEPFTTEEIVEECARASRMASSPLSSAAVRSTSRHWICCCSTCISCCPARSTRSALWPRTPTASLSSCTAPNRSLPRPTSSRPWPTRSWAS